MLNTPPAIGDLDIPPSIVEEVDVVFTGSLQDVPADRPLLDATVFVYRTGDPTDNGLQVPVVMASGNYTFQHRFVGDRPAGYTLVVQATNGTDVTERSFPITVVNNARRYRNLMMWLHVLVMS